MMRISEVVEKNWKEVEEMMNKNIEIVPNPWEQCLSWALDDVSKVASMLLMDKAQEMAYDLEEEQSGKIGHQAGNVWYHYYICSLGKITKDYLKSQQQFQDKRWWM